MQARAEIGARERLRDVDADRDDRQAPANADAGRVFEWIAESIDRVARVEEHRHAELARQIADQLDTADHEVTAAGLLAILVHGRELVQAEAAHALVAACEEALRAG